jgi:hypothetical protein|tara:strand:- start:223 stop:378 length:156 start_codon:yes stop_codon:yes gene_type:complete
MRKWSWAYINWRLTTAYPEGWRFIFLRPITFLKDLWNYLDWCYEIDNGKND